MEQMEQFNPTKEEFFNAMNQMYPTETARVYAEIRSAKMEAFIKRHNEEHEAMEAEPQESNDAEA